MGGGHVSPSESATDIANHHSYIAAVIQLQWVTELERRVTTD